MFRIYRDKIKTFECTVAVEGADLSKAKARLLLENSEYSILFTGDIKPNGKCSIDIGRLKFLSEDLKGKLKLEVIVDDDTYFVPYEDDFIIDTSKKVRVELLGESVTEQTPKVIVEIEKPKEKKPTNTVPSTLKKPQNIKPAVTEAYSRLIEKNVQTLKPNLKKYIVKEILNEVKGKYDIRPENVNMFNNTVLIELKKRKRNG
tara:strand:+ start:1539 stop:2147 length:609 start_codon:yes stop_codon:yes gene_type:complete